MTFCSVCCLRPFYELWTFFMFGQLHERELLPTILHYPTSGAGLPGTYVHRMYLCVPSLRCRGSVPCFQPLAMLYGLTEKFLDPSPPFLLGHHGALRMLVGGGYVCRSVPGATLCRSWNAPPMDRSPRCPTLPHYIEAAVRFPTASALQHDEQTYRKKNIYLSASSPPPFPTTDRSQLTSGNR